MKKICLRCGKEKPLSQFYKHNKMKDGYLNICKKCVKKRVIKHREQNIERIRIYDRIRYRPENLTLGQKEKRKEYCKKWRKEDDRRARAHNLTERKLKDNRPEMCQLCNRKTKLYAHHEDYDDPSKVIWCCQVCHFKLHRTPKNITLALSL